MKFSPEDKIVLPESFGTGMHFKTMEDAAGCKLAKRLLKYKEITSVFLGRDFISVNKKEEVTWAALRPIVLDAMMDAYSEAEARGGDLVEAVAGSSSSSGAGAGGSNSDTAITEEDDEVVAMIKELLETRIRPAVQEDGGDIFYVGFDPESGIVKVKMAGSCVGCPSSTATLRNGVENMLTHYIPEVKGIEQVKDEAEEAGEKELAEMEARIGVKDKE